MDIGLMMKLSGMWMKFSKSHPKVVNFIKAVQKNGIKADTIIDIKITYPDGQVVDANLKVNDDDLKMIEELKKMKK